MLAYFPTPAPDEHFYSIAARYHQRIGHKNPRHTMRELFGKNYHPSTTYLPLNLAYLCSQLPNGTLNTPTEIIKNNSMFPIVRQFMAVGYGNILEDYMINLSQYFSVIFMAHLIYSRGVSERNLKFCQECIDEEMENLGEAYWHRSHQYQGVRVCHKHGCWLYASTSLLLNGEKSHLVTPIDNLVMDNNVSLRADETHSFHLTYSKMVHLCLNSETIHISEKKLDHMYLTGSYCGSSKNNESLKIHDHFVKKFRSFFGAEFIGHINGSSKACNKEMWLNTNIKEYTHPVRCILKMMFYGVSFERLERLFKLKLNTFSS